MFHNQHIVALKQWEIILLLLTIGFSELGTVHSWFCRGDKPGYMCKFRKTCGKSYSRSGYIVEGEDVLAKEFPSLAQLHIGDDTCSGVIVSDRHIVTAAHCVVTEFDGQIRIEREENIRVYVGTNRNVKRIINNGRQVPVRARTVKRICLPTEYPESTAYDQAVLLLDEPLEFDDFVQPACWAYDTEKLKPDKNQRCFAVGVGICSPNLNLAEKARAQKGRVNEVDCETSSSSVVKCHKGSSSSCTACYGDSGGPILCWNKRSEQWFLVATTSSLWRVQEGCKPGNPWKTVVPLKGLAEKTSSYSECGIKS